MKCKYCGNKVPTKWANRGEGWPVCLDCMTEHCVNSNCLFCNFGVYPNCYFLNMKTKAIAKLNNK